jgi:hypothetical protein
MHWRAHFGDAALISVDEAGRRFPNAPRKLDGNAFISHAGKDTPRIREQIAPCIHALYNAKFSDAVFLYSQRSGGADAYKHLVLLALSKCAFGILVVSVNSAKHQWVAAEVDWLIEHHRPLAICLLDSTSPHEIDSRLPAGRGGAVFVGAPVFDFAASASLAPAALGEWVKGLIG